MGQIVILILLVLFDSSKYVEFRKPGASEDTHGSLRIGNLSRVGETSHIDLREILQSLDDMVYTRVGEDVVAASSPDTSETSEQFLHICPSHRSKRL